MPGGHPTDYDETLHPRLAYIACSSGGLTDRKLAEKLDISTSTLHLWRKKHAEFSSQICIGRDEWNVMLAEKALMVRVKGGRYTETTKEPGVKQEGFRTEVDPDTGEEKLVPNLVPAMVVTKVVSKKMAPDPKSIIFHLTNRQSTRWKNTKAVEVSGPDGGSIPIDAKIAARKELLDEVDGVTSNRLPCNRRDE